MCERVQQSGASPQHATLDLNLNFLDVVHAFAHPRVVQVSVCLYPDVSVREGQGLSSSTPGFTPAFAFSQSLCSAVSFRLLLRFLLLLTTSDAASSLTSLHLVAPSTYTRRHARAHTHAHAHTQKHTDMTHDARTHTLAHTTPAGGSKGGSRSASAQVRSRLVTKG